MRDEKAFNYCVRRLEKRFGTGTDHIMHNLARVVNEELDRLGDSYDREAIAALANLYEELYRGAGKLARNRSLSPGDINVFLECYGRALAAGLSPHIQSSISCYEEDGSNFVAVEVRRPRFAFLMVNVYEGRASDFNRDILGEIDTRSKAGILEYAKQPIYLPLQ